ncbi:Chaperone protein HtpG [Clostridiales bacterium CHKCI001]|nr:Chaperone protein HtpG [Clostridiales bacterium CHKCI001]
MAFKQGSLSINSENIFPIIKKWLYSDHDIFFRELVSNGCDAITKLKKLDMMGEYAIPEGTKFKIEVIADSENKTLTFTDNGIGMDADEVEEYINQIAFSGAQDFLEKYKDKTNEDQIIGHFGLGFYSSFMVADRVTIDTLSWKPGATAVHWESDGGTDFEMSDSDKTEIGTTITLYLNEDSYEFCNEFRAREVLMKYCSFMPVEIYLTNPNAEPEYEEVEPEKSEESDTEASAEVVDEEGKTVKEKKLKEPTPINDTTPLWTKHPNDCTDEEYKEFYRNVFMDYKEPLFWIHLNMDYPFNLKGILYFPKINTEYDSIEGTIKLYNNQVFIADNIKEVIPEFLMLLKGVIDCPDLPLNVSRSALQNDGFVKKISDYITKKVADKLSGMCKTDRESYEKYWDDINPFIKFGCLKDEKFANKMNDYIIFKNLEGKYITLPDALKENEEKHKNTVFYVTDEKEQSQYINMFKKEGIDAVILKHNIDAPFITHLEQKNKDVKFLRIDAEVTDTLKEEVKEEDAETLKANSEALTELFKKALNNDKLDVKVERLKDSSIASMMTTSEESRRMQEMMKMYGMAGMDLGTPGETLVLNINHDLVQYVLNHKDADNINTFCEQLYDLAALAHGTLTPDRMTQFITRSNQIMMLLAK